MCSIFSCRETCRLNFIVSLFVLISRLRSEQFVHKNIVAFRFSMSTLRARKRAEAEARVAKGEDALASMFAADDVGLEKATSSKPKKNASDSEGALPKRKRPKKAARPNPMEDDDHAVVPPPKRRAKGRAKKTSASPEDIGGRDLFSPQKEMTRLQRKSKKDDSSAFASAEDDGEEFDELFGDLGDIKSEPGIVSKRLLPLV